MSFDQQAQEVRLKVGAAQIRLGLGETVIGRSPSCDVVLHSSKVSRKHACIYVTPSSVRIEDLGSANGVFVNGHPISNQRPLTDGDRIVIGGEELEVVFGQASPLRNKRPGAVTRSDRPTRTALQDSNRPIRPVLSDSEPPSGSPGTRRADAFELIGQIVDRALSEGRAADAESMLHVHLTKVLDEARTRGTLAEQTRQSAVTYSLKIASATGRGRWLDYVFELLAALKVPLEGQLAESIRAAAAKVDDVNAAKVARYVDAIKALGNDRQSLATSHATDAVMRTVAARRGSNPPLR